MKYLLSVKMILRSWWRNKTFSLISIMSIGIGLACTNLLFAFVIHEYNIEANNPNREHILYMSQDSPMQQGETISWIRSNIPPMLKEKYAEVENYLRFIPEDLISVLIEDQYHAPFTIVKADASFPDFFPYDVIAGSIDEALTEPNKLALTESIAKRLFGEEYPIGKNIIVQIASEEIGTEGQFVMKEVNHTYTIAALLRDRDQSFLHIEALSKYPEGDHGGVSMLLMNQMIDLKLFSEKLKKDGVPTIQGDIGCYHFSTLKDSYFKEGVREDLSFIVRRQPTLLYIGFGSAILILLIACINYVNLNFSRLFQQTRMIHIQKLMGSSDARIMTQLFLDTFLTVLAAFLLSLFIAYDLLPIFNRSVGGSLNATFFFDKQVFPVVFGLILLFSIIPAYYMGRKILAVSLSGYNDFFTGKKKGRIIAALSIVQYIISIGLTIATITVNNQVKLVQNEGKNYKNVIEIGDGNEDFSFIHSLAGELDKYPELQTTMAEGSLLYAWLKQTILKDEAGNEVYCPMLTYSGEASFLNTLHIDLIQGIPPEQAIKHYTNPVYINKRFAELLVPTGENPIGKPLKIYDTNYHGENTDKAIKENSITTIAGIIANLYTNSLENEVYPITVHVHDYKDRHYPYLYVRITEDQKRSLTLIRQEWEKINPNKYFTYRDVYQDFLSRNNKPIELSHILLMYSFISLFLTCFGLFGMSFYTIKQRTKEIALRKINGAATIQIISLLIRQFLGYIIIAFIIAAPISWLLLNRWLQYSVYRVNVTLLTCLMSFLITLIITLLTISWHTYKAAMEDPAKVLKAD